jgi:hypothetical protein
VGKARAIFYENMVLGLVLEVFVDRLFGTGEENESMPRWIFDDRENGYVESLVWRINRVLLHELAHWGGCKTAKSAHAVEFVLCGELDGLTPFL